MTHTTATLAASLTDLLNTSRPLDTAEIAPVAEISTAALGWKLSRQVHEALSVNGFHEQRLLTCDIANPSSADAVYLSNLHVRVQARFNETLAAHQSHIRAAEKLQKQLVQPIAVLGKALARVEKIEADIKAAGADVPAKLQGQLGAAGGELKKAQQRVSDIQAQIDAQFAAARVKMTVFLAAKRAEEYTRSLPRTTGSTSADQLLWLQHMIRQTHLWDPTAVAFNSIANRYR